MPRGCRSYDAVVLDAPPTGGSRSSSASTASSPGWRGSARSGSQADQVMKLFRSPRTAIHLVTVLEEMPVQETADGIARAAPRGAAGRLRGRQHGAPAGPRRRPARGGPVGHPRRGTDQGRPGRRRPRRRATTSSTGCWPRRTTTPYAGSWRTPSAPSSPASASRSTSCRGCAGGVDLGGLYELAADLKDGAWHEPRAPRTGPRARFGPLAAPASAAPALDVDALLDDRGTEIIVCCGSGGVGKTTTSAALALRAAERGRRVVVLTIDPARRLAQSMGIERLDNTPRPVPGVDRPRDARRDDAGHEAHLRRGRGEPGHAREGAADPGQPVLRRAVQLLRRHPGVHGDGEARPDPPAGAGRRRLRPDRRRHPAVALGAGLPRRPRAALAVPRRPLHPAAARARRGGRRG